MGLHMGVNVAVFADDVRRYFDGSRQKPALIRLIIRPEAPPLP
ncbi:MAG: hypothetical protein AABY90_08600 [Nitrospirota bacterium]